MLPDGTILSDIRWRRKVKSDADYHALCTLATAKAIIVNSADAEVFSYDEIDLARPGREKCAYFVISPLNDTYRFILSLFFSCAFEALQNEGESTPGNSLPVSTYFLFDEFKSIGTISDFSNKLANVRKYNVTIVIILQDFNQLMDSYGDRKAYSIIANCERWLILGVNDPFTAKLISDRSGEATIVNTTTSERRSKGGADFVTDENVSTSDGKRLIVTPNEVMTMPQNEAFVIINRKGLYKCYAYKYWYHYLTEFVSMDENKRSSLEYEPAWTFEDIKTMDKKRTFLGVDPQFQQSSAGAGNRKSSGGGSDFMNLSNII